MTTRRSTLASHSDNNIRKRVCKACDRCRLKKSKCDSIKPCGRCRADDTLCTFGKRKKAHDKVYPRGYVEVLEQQQTWLVNGLQELYQRLLEGDGWQGEPLKCEPNGQPLTHDLLTQLGALDLSKHEQFRENVDIIQQKLWKNNNGHMQHRDSSDTSSKSAHSNTIPPHFSDSFTVRALPQTPTALRIEPLDFAIKSEPYMTLNNPAYVTPMQTMSVPRVMDPSDLQSAQLESMQWSDFGNIDNMPVQYDGLPYHNSITSPMFNRQMLMGLNLGSYIESKNNCEDINQFLNTQWEFTL